MAKDHFVSFHKLFQHGSLNRCAASGSVELFHMHTYSTKLSTYDVKNKLGHLWEPERSVATHVHSYSKISCCRSLTRRSNVCLVLWIARTHTLTICPLSGPLGFRHLHCCDTDPAGLAGRHQLLHVTKTNNCSAQSALAFANIINFRGNCGDVVQKTCDLGDLSPR